MPGFQDQVTTDLTRLRQINTSRQSGLYSTSLPDVKLHEQLADLRGQSTYDVLPVKDRTSILDSLKTNILGPLARSITLPGNKQVSQLWADAKSTIGKAYDTLPQPVRDVLAETRKTMGEDVSKQVGIYKETGRLMGNDLTELERGNSVLQGIFGDKGASAIGRFASGGVQGMTGGLLHPTENTAPQGVTDEIAGVLGQIGGMTVGIGKLSDGLRMLALKPQAVSDFVAAYPTISKFLLSIGTSAGSLGAYGQLDPTLGADFSARAKRLGDDLKLGGLYGVLPFIPKGPHGIGNVLAVSAAGGLGYKLAKMSGADDTTALTWGIALGILDMSGRVQMSRPMAEQSLSAESESALRKFNIEVPENYTDAQLTKIRRDALIKYHPDKTGSTKEIRTINEALGNLQNVPQPKRARTNIEGSSFTALKEELGRLFGKKQAKPLGEESQLNPPQEDIRQGETVESYAERKGGWKPGEKAVFDSALNSKDAATVKKMLPNVPQEYQSRFFREIGALVPEARNLPATTGGSVVVDGQSYSLPTQKEIEMRPTEVQSKLTARINELMDTVKTTTGGARDKLKQRIAVITNFRDAVQPLPRIVVDDASQIPRTGNIRREFEVRMKQIRENPPKTPESIRALSHFSYVTQTMGGHIMVTRGRFDPRLFLPELAKSAPAVADKVRGQEPLINVEMREERMHAREMNTAVQQLKEKSAPVINQMRADAAQQKREQFHKKVEGEIVAEKEAVQKDRTETREKAGVAAIANSSGLTRKAVAQYLEDHGLGAKDLIERKPAEVRAAVVKGEKIAPPTVQEPEPKPEDQQRLEKLKENPHYDKALEYTMAEMLELAQPGYRVMPDIGNQGDQGAFGVPSTFPSWVSEDLRSSDLFLRVSEDIKNGTYPAANATREIRLYKEVVDHIEQMATKDVPQLMQEAQQMAESTMFKMARGVQKATAKVLDTLKDKGEVVSKQEIKDALTDIPSEQKSAIEAVLKDSPKEVNIAEFSKAMNEKILGIFDPQKVTSLLRTRVPDLIQKARNEQRLQTGVVRTRMMRRFNIGTKADADRILQKIKATPEVRIFYNDKSLALITDFIKNVPAETLGSLDVDFVNGLLQPAQDARWRKGVEGSYHDNVITMVLEGDDWKPGTFHHEFAHHYYEKFLSPEEKDVVWEAYDAAQKDETAFAALFGEDSAVGARVMVQKYIDRAKETRTDVDTVLVNEFFANSFEKYVNDATREKIDEKVKDSPFKPFWDMLKHLFSKAKDAIGRLLNVAKGSYTLDPSLEKIFKDIYEPNIREENGQLVSDTQPKSKVIDRPYFTRELGPSFKFKGGEADRLLELQAIRQGMIDRGERTAAIDSMIKRIETTIPPEASVPVQSTGDVIDKMSGNTDALRVNAREYEAKPEITNEEKAAFDAIANPDIRMSPERTAILNELVEIEDSLPRWKDAGSLGMSRETMERNLDKVAGENAPMVKRFLTEPTLNNETDRLRYLTTVRASLRKDVVQALHIRPGSDEEMTVQKWGEGKMTEEDLAREVPNEKKREDIKKAASILRNRYDQLINLWNEKRAAHGLDPIPKQKDYFRHMHVINNTIDQFGLFMGNEDLPTEIAGITDVFKPGTPFTTAALHREGFDTDFAAIRGMDEYLDSVSRAIYHTDSVQRGRLLERTIRRTAKDMREKRSAAIESGMAEEESPLLELPRFATNLTEWTNLLSGKKGRLDRGFEDIFGRPFYQVMRVIGQKTGANMIAGNVSAALTNFIPLTASIATTNKIAAMRGLAEAVIRPTKVTTIDGQESGFLTRRFAPKAIATRMLRMKDFLPNELSLKGILRPLGTNIDNTAVDHASRFLFDIIDPFVSRMVVAGKYYEHLSNGVEPKEAMRRADKYAANVITDRTIGQLPNLFGQRVIGPLTQFQTEVNNQWSFYTKDIPDMANGSKIRMASAYLQLIVYGYLFNSLYEKITGHRVTLDPIYSAMTLMGMTPEGQDADALHRILAVGKDVSGNLPFTGSILSGRFPISAGIPNIADVASGQSTWGKELAKPATFLLAPVAGLQAKKTFEGIRAVLEGGRYTSGGNLSYPIEQTTENYIQKGIFGPYADAQANEYFGAGLGPMNKNQTLAYKKLLEAGRQDEGMTLYGMSRLQLYSGQIMKDIMDRAKAGDKPTELDLKEARAKILEYKKEVLKETP